MAIKSFLSEGGFSVGSVGSTPIEVIDSSGNVTAVGLTVSGNLVVNGSTTTINSTTTTLDDPIFTLGGDTAPTSDDNKDRGIEFRWHTGSLAKVGFFGYDDSTGKFVFIPDATNNSEVFAGTKGTLDANIEWADVLNKPDPVVTVTLTGDVTGTANATLTDLGNGTITVATTIAADSIALGTDTTGNYVASITNGSYITGGNGGSEGAALTLAVDATSANTASKVVARDASGNFSAGVITGTRLEARNSGATQIYLDSTTSGSKEIVFQNNGATAGYVWASGSYVGLGGGGTATSLFVTAASGNTGIGTTSPGGRLEVNFTAATGATALILRTSDGGANGTIRWQNSTAVNGAAIGSNYNVSDVGALEFLNGTTTNVIFRSSGNVGIGTTAPGQKLEVNGNILAGNSVANNSISVTRTGANSSSLSLQAFTDSPAITWDGAGGYLRFIYSSTEQMRITSGGNVGIGVTSPGAKLHVAGAHADESADRAATTAFIVDTKTNGTGDGKTYIKTGWVNTGNYGVSTLAVGYYASGTQVRDVITMLGTGNVGIGTTAPTYKFEISGTAASGGVARIGSIDYTSTTVLSVAPGVVNFDAPGVVGGRFTINSSGNVGIGNVSPSHKLDVTGSIRTTDWYYVDGSGFGMYNNATGLYLSTIGNNWDISSASGQTWSGLRLYSGGKNVTWRGNFYGDSTGQGFLDSAGNWALRVDSSKRLIAYSGIANMDAGIRVSMPGGAAYATTTSTITGAFKIKLPTARYKSDSMLRMTINIYQYSTGQSLKFNVGGYNYNHATNAWLNVFAEQESDSNATVYTVRFGDDGTSNCIWIGETNSTWSYPQVFVSDFQAGFGGTTADWASSWAITAVTAFDTVYTSRVSAIKVTSNNIGTYGVSSITGTANQVTASASTGAVTLSLPQNIHTGATPTFSSLTLSGDVITLSGSGVSAYANSTARIYNQAGVGPTINGNSLEVRTGSSGTLALTVNSSQHSLFVGRASTGVFPGFTSAQLPQYGMGVAYGTDATSYAATGATRAPDGYTIAIGPFNNTNRYSQIVFGVGNGSVNGFSYIGGAAHGTSYLAHLIFGRTTGAASYAESMRIDGSSGNVLIGTTTDGGQKLQVNGTALIKNGASGAAVATNAVLRLEDSSNLALSVNAPDANAAGVYFGRAADAYYSGIERSATSTLIRSGGITALTLDSSQNATFAGATTTFQGSAGNTNLIAVRATTSNGSTFQYKTGATLNWYHGLRGLVNNNWYLFNNATSTNTLIFDAATEAATFAGAVTAAGNLTVSGTGTSAINNLSITPTSGHVYLTGPSAAGKFITLQNGNATGGINFRDSAGNEVGSYYQVTDAWVFSKNTTVSGNLTVSQNLIVNGTTTTVNSTVSTIKDPIVTLGGGDAGTAAASDDNKDRGIEFKWHNGTAAKTGFFGFDDSTGYFTFIPDATNTSEVFSGTQGDIQATNFRGALIGNVTGTASGNLALTGGTLSGKVTWATNMPNQKRILGIYETGNIFTGIGMAATTASPLIIGDPGVNVLTDFGYLSNDGSYTWNSVFTVEKAVIRKTNVGAVQFVLNSTDSSSKEIVFQNNGSTAGYVWHASTYVAMGGGNVNNSLFVNGGYVGIGVIGTATKLEVYDSTNAVTAIRVNNPNTGTAAHSSIQFANANSTNGAGVLLFGSGYTTSGLYRQDGMYIYTNRGGGITLNVETNNPMYFATSNTERMRIDGSGNVGVGTGSGAVDFKTTIAADITMSGDVNPGTAQLSVQGSTTPGKRMLLGYDTTGNGYGFIKAGNFGVTWTTLSLQPSGGNVSIGTTSNSYKLHVAGDIYASSGYIRVNSTNAFYFETYGGGWYMEDTSWIRTVNAKNIWTSTGLLGSNGGLTVGYGGNAPNTTYGAIIAGSVGIGTASPSAKLHVSGGRTYLASSDGYELAFARSGSYFYFYNDGNGSTGKLSLTDTAGIGNHIITFTQDTRNVGIGTTSPGYKLEVNGSFAATTKSFVIKHPTKPGKKLRYGSLEGPENGVYVRGKLKGSNVIELPDYWTKLIDPESITVQLTPIGSHQKLYVEKIEDNKVYIANENLLSKAINCFFYVLAERIDVEKLQVEIDA